MRNYICLLLIVFGVISCSENNVNEPTENLSTADLIELIKSHEGKAEIGFEELPVISQDFINSLGHGITAELILHAQDLGYEVRLKRASRNLMSLLNILYVYFNENGELLFNENYDEDNDGDYDIFDNWVDYMCFDIQFPISINMPSGSQISVENEESLYEAIEEYYESADEYDDLPEINFPINIIFYYENEDGSVFEEIIGINSYEELEMYFNMCPDENEWDDEEWFDFDCVDIVYPISIENPEGEILSVESEDELNEYINQYYENCNGLDCGDFTLIYPLTIEYYSENNNQTETLTINSEEEMEEYLGEYCYNDDDDDEGGLDTCGEIVYPVTVEAPNGEQFTGDSEEDIMLMIEEWYSNNCNSTECDYEFELVFPLTMEFEDSQGDIIVMTIQSEVMLEEINAQYCED